MEYTVYRVQGNVDWTAIPVAKVEEYSWGGTYRPKVTAQMALIADKGLAVRMTCEESSPRAVYTQNQSMVCEDSCMECFLIAKPLLSGSYLNFEVNANGAMLCAFGPDRHHRVSLPDYNLKEPEVTVTKSETSWTVEYVIDFTILRRLYGSCDFASGESLRANFYKCGDNTETPHYGSWMPIDWPSPDFHRPEFFGTLRIA